MAAIYDREDFECFKNEMLNDPQLSSLGHAAQYSSSTSFMRLTRNLSGLFH